MKPLSAIFFLLGVAFPTMAYGQSEPPETPHLDKILERRVLSPEEEASLNQDADPAIDVRDLVIFLNGQPVSATFGSAETLAFQSSGSVTLPIYFSKPVTGTIRLDLGGNALEGGGEDFTVLYDNPSTKTFAVTNQVSLPVTLMFSPWRGMGGEKVVRLSVNRDPSIIPNNGVFGSHLLRIRQFEEGEFVGMLTFPAGTGLPSLAVRIGLSEGGSAVCSFQQTSSLLGEGFTIPWTAGADEFPAFPGVVDFTLPGADFGRAVDLSATLTFQRMSPPYGEQLDAYLEGFPIDDQPALFDAICTFPDLFRAGAAISAGPNPYAIVHQGRLALQPVSYDEAE